MVILSIKKNFVSISTFLLGKALQYFSESLKLFTFEDL